MDLTDLENIKEIIIIVFSIVAIYISFSKKIAIIEEKITELCKSVEKHNNIVERTFKLEQKVENLEKHQKN